MCTNKISLLNLKQSSDRLVIFTKSFLKLANLHMLIKQKSPSKTEESITSQKLGSMEFWWIANSVLNKGWSDIPPLFNGWRCCLVYLIKQNCLRTFFLRPLILMTWVSLYLFCLFELFWNCITSVTSNMVNKFIANLNSSKASGPHCIQWWF